MPQNLEAYGPICSTDPVKLRLARGQKHLPVKGSTIVHLHDNAKFVRIDEINNTDTDANHQTQATRGQDKPKAPAKLKF